MLNALAHSGGPFIIAYTLMGILTFALIIHVNHKNNQ